MKNVDGFWFRACTVRAYISLTVGGERHNSTTSPERASGEVLNALGSNKMSETQSRRVENKYVPEGRKY